MKRTKANALTMYWSKAQKDIVYRYPEGKCDSRLLHNTFAVPRMTSSGEFNRDVLSELEARGYDLTTLRFSICKKEK